MSFSFSGGRSVSASLRQPTTTRAAGTATLEPRSSITKVNFLIELLPIAAAAEVATCSIGLGVGKFLGYDIWEWLEYTIILRLTTDFH